MSTSSVATAERVDRRLVLLMAIACGATAANLYYAQPLLPAIAAAFGIGEAPAGLLVTVSQLSYATGLVLIVPLGDLVDRTRLIVRLLAVCAAGLAVTAAAPQVAILALALAVASVTSVVVQIVIPFASTLAPEHERGQVLGLVSSGTLTGILLARTVSGLVAHALGWRAPFAMAAVAMAVLAVALRRWLPRVPPPANLPYRALLRSVGALVASEPVLRRRMIYGACGYAGFGLAWTALSFLLSGPAFGYGPRTIGLFGLAGLVGAAGAQRFGRQHDRGLGHAATGAVLAAIVVSWGVLALGGHTVAPLLVGLVLLDFAVQGQNVLSQGAIYALGTGQASRVTTAYITSLFLGGALGSAAGAVAWDAGGWSAVCGVGAAIGLVALVAWLAEPR